MQQHLPIAIERLVQIVARLRSPGGCPWDAEQTPESLQPFVLEEAYELIEAIELGEVPAIREELGDLLLQVVLQTRIFEERGAFDLADVAGDIADKLERRHPHVFKNTEQLSPPELKRQWEAIKQGEKVRQGKPHSTLGKLPPALPALMKAKKLTERASRAGFDWPDIDGAIAKVHEELAECEEALMGTNLQHMENELGDLLFAVVNLGRFLNIDAESALRATIRRFTNRFNHVENRLQAADRKMDKATLEELLALWEEAKRKEGINPE